MALRHKKKRKKVARKSSLGDEVRGMVVWDELRDGEKQVVIGGFYRCRFCV